MRFQDLVPFGPAVSGNYDVASHGLGQFARLPFDLYEIMENCKSGNV